MKSHVRPLVLALACLVVLGVMVFAAACGDSEEATTTTAAPATTTTAAATETTAAATSGSMTVKGMVDKPGTLTVADLEAMKVSTITAEHPKKGATEYKGVLLSDLMAAVGVQSGATLLDMGASDGFMGEVTLADLDPNAMIAIEDGMLNAVMPGMDGKAWVKDIVTLEFK